MILYIPTTEAEGLQRLIAKHSNQYLNPSIRYDLLQQIEEQTPKKTTTVSLNDLIDKRIKLFNKLEHVNRVINEEK